MPAQLRCLPPDHTDTVLGLINMALAQAADGKWTAHPRPLLSGLVLPHSLTIMLVQKLALEPTLARHSREGKAEGKLARWEIGAFYFVLAPAAWEGL